MKRPGSLAVAMLALGLLAGCASHPMAAPVNVLDKRVDAQHPATYNGLPLRSGQLVLTESPDATSFAFMLIPDAFHAFTHIAVLSMENGEPWVYDVTGGIKAIPSRSRLLDNIKGKMYRRPLFEYVGANLHAEIYDPPSDTDGERLAAYVRSRYAEGKVEFDTRFDPRDHRTLYCSELVALAIAAGGGRPPAIGKSSHNPSIVKTMAWLGVPADTAYPVTSFIEPSRYVAALGQFPTRSAAWSYFEAKREIYRRFADDQRLGLVLTMGGNGQLGVRPEIVDFAVTASHLFDAEETPPQPGDPRIGEAVRALADRRFGALPQASRTP